MIGCLSLFCLLPLGKVVQGLPVLAPGVTLGYAIDRLVAIDPAEIYGLLPPAKHRAIVLRL